MSYGISVTKPYTGQNDKILHLYETERTYWDSKQAYIDAAHEESAAYQALCDAREALTEAERAEWLRYIREREK